jgi:hypothetical protein
MLLNWVLQYADGIILLTLVREAKVPGTGRAEYLSSFSEEAPAARPG